MRLTDNGSAAGWESLSPPAPTHAPVREDGTRRRSEERQALAASAASMAERQADRDYSLAQSQHAGLTLMIGLADRAGVTEPASPGWPQVAVRPATARPATIAPAPAPPRRGGRGHQAVLVRPTAHARPRQPVRTQPSAPSRDQEPDSGPKFTHLPGLSLIVIILSVQATLAALFIRANTAFGDEALYLWAGRLEWSHWLHGTAIPAFATSFGGSPALYPPVGALADSLGGLAAARALSLGFMLGATVLLWGSTARMFGRPAAYFAAGLFAVLGPTLHLGAFATFDAMALFLLALAAWCACAARSKQEATGWMIGCAAALALANATKYTTVLFDPVVLLMAVLSAGPQPGGKVALRRGALLITCLTGLLALLLRLGGPWYVIGIGRTTTQRPAGQDPFGRVFSESWQWTAVVLGAALAAVLISLIKRNSRWLTWLIAVLAGAALLVPAGQARFHTTVSLGKNVDFGAWFACAAAGYALATLVTVPRPRLAKVAVAAVVGLALVPVAANGLIQARALANWPGAGSLIRFLRPLTSHGGHFLAESEAVPAFYLPDTSWQQWSNTFSLTKPDGDAVLVHGASAPFAHAIRQHYFSVVVMSFSATRSMDDQITAVLRQTPGYHLSYVPYTGPVSGNYVVWVYDPATTGARPSQPLAGAGLPGAAHP
ncbi:MAG TPA: glycosyltransferase family 39 protein [Streptosporangiaceae bacterium]